MKTILPLILIALTHTLTAQVNDSLYNLTLRNLLAHSVNEISVREAQQQTGVLFLDARERAEFDVSHIKNAANVGYQNFDNTCLQSVPKDQRIIVYCSVGYRSEKVAEKIKAAGYTQVFNLYGGIFEWVNEGNTVYDNAGKPTAKVHAYNHTWGIWLKKGEKVF